MNNQNENAQKGIISIFRNIFLSKYISLVIALIMIFFTIVLWGRSETDGLTKISKNLVTSSEIYVNNIETRFENIEFALSEVANSSPPYTKIEMKDWDYQTNFYTQNYRSLENIAWIDRDLIIQRVMPTENLKYILNKEINNEMTDSDHINILTPVYDGEKLEGFLLGNVNILELISSIRADYVHEYDVLAYSNETFIETNNNVVNSKKDISETKKILYKNKIFYLVLKPTKELMAQQMRNSYQILIYGLSLSIGVFILLFFLQILRKKSKTLVQTQKELEVKNLKLVEQLRNEQKLQTIGTLASGVAHEINNPINGIMNYSQLIFDAAEKNSENSQYSKEIINETQRVAALVNNILSFSRQVKDKHSIARTEDIILRTLSLMKIIFKQDQIDLQMKISKNLPNIRCRSQQIQQVLMNLLTNSRDALNEKYMGHHENKKILLDCETIKKEKGVYVRITVEDHGNGIPAEVQKRMFKEFYTTKAIDVGTGLGLFISMQIVKEHYGELTFETIEDSYTKFYLDLPVIKEKES